MVYKHAYLNTLFTVAAFRIYAQRGEDAAIVTFFDPEVQRPWHKLRLLILSSICYR